MEGGVSVPEDRGDAAKQAAGLVRVEVWVPRDMADAVKDFVQALVRENSGGPQLPKVTTLDQRKPKG